MIAGGTPGGPVVWGVTAPVPPLGFGLIPGPRELVLVALVVLALYGRTSSRLLLSTRYGRALAPWVRLAEGASGRFARAARKAAAAAPTPTPRPRGVRGWVAARGRWSWALALTAAAAAAAWVATRVVVHQAAPH